MLLLSESQVPFFLANRLVNSRQERLIPPRRYQVHAAREPATEPNDDRLVIGSADEAVLPKVPDCRQERVAFLDPVAAVKVVWPERCQGRNQSKSRRRVPVRAALGSLEGEVT